MAAADRSSDILGGQVELPSKDEYRRLIRTALTEIGTRSIDRIRLGFARVSSTSVLRRRRADHSPIQTEPRIKTRLRGADVQRAWRRQIEAATSLAGR